MTDTEARSPIGRGAQRPRADGERTRAAILKAATELATIEGLEGLSIGRLAQHVGMSKSGLYAHFDSKQALQLATIDAARDIFTREVYTPGLQGAPGVTRVIGLCEAFLQYVERRVFPGGCFFTAAAAELDTREGPLVECVRDFYADWHEKLSRLIAEAREMGELSRCTDADQLAFELGCLLHGADLAFTLFADPQATERARRGVMQRLDRSP